MENKYKFVTVNKDLYSITLDEKIKLCRDHGKWVGAENKIDKCVIVFKK